MSAAGVIFLSILGFFFYIESTALFPDLYFKEGEIVTIKLVFLPISLCLEISKQISTNRLKNVG